MTDLRTRIVAVQRAHMGDAYEQDMGECPCGFKYSTCDELAAHLADVLIRELGWRKESESYAVPDATRTRYVTNWEAE